MRGVAQQPEPEPAPDRAETDAKLAGVLGELAGFVSRGRSLLACCPDPELLRQHVEESVRLQLQVSELRSEEARLVVALAADDSKWAGGWKACEAAMRADASVPAPRHGHRRASRRQPGEGQRALFSVKLSAIGAFVALKLAPVAKPLGKVSRHVLHHGTGIKLTAHTVKLAAAAAAVPAAGALVIAGAVVISHPSPSGPSAVPGASVPDWHTSATPFPSTSLIAKTVTHPKAKHGTRKQFLSASGLPLPCCEAAGPEPSASSPPSSQAAPAVSVQAGPAVLTVSTSALDLSGIATSETFTISASGSGWASWRISTTGTDLTFWPDHGVLKAGGQATVTVSLASALDALTQQAFAITTQGVVVSQVTVALPVPVPLPSVSVDPAASVLPSVPDPLAS